MRGSQFSVLIANLFLLGSFITLRPLASLGCLFLASLWLISALTNILLERKQFYLMAREIEEYNKIMAENFKNGDRTNKRRR